MLIAGHGSPDLCTRALVAGFDTIIDKLLHDGVVARTIEQLTSGLRIIPNCAVTTDPLA